MNKITRKRPVTMYLMTKVYKYTGVYDKIGLKTRYKNFKKYTRKRYKYHKDGKLFTFKKYEQYVKEYYDYAEYELNPIYSN